MHYYIVAQASLFDNDVKVELFEAETWQEALGMAKLAWIFEGSSIPNVEEAKLEAFQGDVLLDIRVLAHGDGNSTRLLTVEEFAQFKAQNP